RSVTARLGEPERSPETANHGRPGARLACGERAAAGRREIEGKSEREAELGAGELLEDVGADDHGGFVRPPGDPDGLDDRTTTVHGRALDAEGLRDGEERPPDVRVDGHRRDVSIV